MYYRRYLRRGTRWLESAIALILIYGFFVVFSNPEVTLALPAALWGLLLVFVVGGSVYVKIDTSRAKREARAARIDRQKVASRNRKRKARSRGEKVAGLITTCAGCGEVKKAGSSACPHCGSSPSVVRFKGGINDGPSLARTLEERHGSD